MDSSGNDQVDKPTSEEVNEPTRIDAFEPAQASTYEPLPEPAPVSAPVPGTLQDKAVPVERGVLERLVSGTFHDPHQILGPHLGDGAVTAARTAAVREHVTAVTTATASSWSTSSKGSGSASSTSTRCPTTGSR